MSETLKTKYAKKGTQKKAPELKKSTTTRNVTLKPKKVKKKLTKIKIVKKLSSSKIENILSSIKADTEEPMTQDNIKTYNDDFIRIIGEVQKIVAAKGETFRARQYKKAQEAIIRHTEPITDVNQVKKIRGIGDSTFNKLKEFVDNGKVDMIEVAKSNPVNTFTEVYGIGPAKARELVDKHGIRSIEELRKNETLLNDKQKIGLKYYEDILNRIPRDEIDEYHTLLTRHFKSLKIPTASFDIVGSYRRGANDSGDIDIIITDETGDTDVFKKFLDKLIDEGIVIEVLSRGDVKSLAISQLPPTRTSPRRTARKTTPRRIDFLYTPPQEYAFALLYFTGSASFNTMMRQRALDIGYSLNEHGLYHMVNKKRGNRLDMLFKDEQAIFDFLSMEYKTPEERKYSSAVVIKKEDEISKQEPILTKSSKPSKITKKLTNFRITKSKKAEMQSRSQSPGKRTIKKSTLKKKVTKKDASSLSEQALNHIKSFENDGVSYLKKLTEDQLNSMIIMTNDAYYNKDALLEDNSYDILKEFIEKKFPDNKIIKEIGAPVTKKKVQLPYHMGSMDKIKPDTGALPKWKETYKGPYVLSGKLDGISALYTTEGENAKLYTRGNGTMGQDITHLIPYLKLPKTKDVTIRGELIIKRAVFDKMYSGTTANPRNFVSGVVNAKSIEKAKYLDIDFVAYEVVHPEMKPSEQMKFLSDPKNNVLTVINETISRAKLTNELLSEKLVEWRNEYDYETDGVIVTNDDVVERVTKGNPKHGFAFKMVLSEQIAEVKVLDVIWTPSKHGYLKPRIQIEPVKIGGAEIEYATAFNAAFVEENRIGVGALIKLVRSGDVIPHIMEVITPAKKAKMPNVEYEWNDTHVDIMLKDAISNDVVKSKNILAFFKGIGVEGMGPGIVNRLVQNGYDTIESIIKMDQDDFTDLEGFQEKSAKTLVRNIATQLKTIPLEKLMAAKNGFGRGMGVRRITAILSKYPDILLSKDSDEEKYQKLLTVPTIADKMAPDFIAYIPTFVDFAREIGVYNKITDYQKELEKAEESFDTSHPLYKKTIVMTGFRDKVLIVDIAKYGAKIGSLSKKTVALLVKDKESADTGKAEKAKQMGIPIMTVEEFREAYKV